MKKTLFASLLCSSLCVAQLASADTLAQWTFETSILASSTPSFSPGAGIASTNFFAEAGLQSGTAYAFGLHSGASAYTSPAGNGSAKSLSSTAWAVDDYYQFSLNTVGYSGISVAFDQMGSNTGPKDFGLSYSTDGTTFIQFATYSVINASWSAGTPTANPSSYSFDLSAITDLDNAASVYFRLVNTSTASINNGTVAAGGTGRVDNFTVTATAVPEPSALALLGGFGALGLFMNVRRRK